MISCFNTHGEHANDQENVDEVSRVNLDTLHCLKLEFFGITEPMVPIYDQVEIGVNKMMPTSGP